MSVQNDKILPFIPEQNSGILHKPINNQLIGIQYLRGIAAVLVVLDHITGMAKLPKYLNIDILSGWFIAGAVGVELFFVISGFIICYVSLDKHSLSPKIAAPAFFLRRFIRIIPFMWICILGYAILKLIVRGALPGVEYINSMFLFPIGGVQPNVIWTLRHEFLFYGVFCLFAIYFKHQWKALILWFLSPFIWFSLGINSYLEPSAFRELCDFLFSKVNLLFGIGLLIAVLGMKGYLNFKVATKHTFLLSLLSVVPLFVISRYIGVGEELEYKQIIISGVISALVVIVGISLQASKPLTLFDRLGLKLGDASYSIYLIHTGVISVMFIIWPKLHLPVNPILVLAVGCVLCCLIGIAVHLYIEKPVIKLVQSKLEPAKVKH